MKFKNNNKIMIAIGIATLAVIFLFLINKDRTDNNFRREDLLLPMPISKEESYPDTIPEMSKKDYSGSDFKLGKILAENEFYTRYAITYKSEDLTISGMMNIPKGKGSFPVLILNHGYYDPKVYTSGEGLSREQDFFARNGYAVLLSDYRNYGLSDYDPKNEVRPRAGYVEDIINAVSAVKTAGIENLDKENIGMLGHSMGGGATINVMVTKPDTAKAYALLAPINSDYKINFDRWVKTEWPETAQQFYDIYGTYEENPSVWESLSAKNYFEKINAPIQLHQGALDAQVPARWSRDLTNSLRGAGKDISYYEYPNEDHVFIKSQDLAMQRTLEFFNSYLKQ